jgi:hypothetical protein
MDLVQVGVGTGSPKTACRRARLIAGLAIRALGTLALAISAGCGPTPQCADFTSSSIAAMRALGGSGCYELGHVLVVAREPNSATSRLYVQDAAGGPMSAIVAKCSSSSSFSCADSVAVTATQLLVGTAITARGYYQRGKESGFEELYLADLLDEGKLVPLPEPAHLDISRLARDEREPAAWFQMADVEVPPSDPLTMYDFSPAEFLRSGACPISSGFAMIPASAGAPAPSGCNGNANPPGIASPDPREVLIGRQFFSTFWASTDCQCAAASKQHLLAPTGTLVGSIRGLLVLEALPGSLRGYQVFQPISKMSFPVIGG